MDVLVVDDEPIARRFVEHVLRGAGYNVLSAATAAAGLELMRQHPCPVVVTDWHMPDMNGLEFCRALRSIEQRTPLYAILITARELSKEEVQGLYPAVDDCLTKPFAPAALLARVDAARRSVSEAP